MIKKHLKWQGAGRNFITAAGVGWDWKITERFIENTVLYLKNLNIPLKHTLINLYKPRPFSQFYTSKDSGPHLLCFKSAAAVSLH